MDIDFKEFPWATVLTALATLVVVIVGGVVVIFGEPGALSFQDYVKDLTGLGVANGLLGIGRGIRSGAKFRSR